MPALDFSDLIAESKQQALANAMIQLGAGVASGDISKGLAAAGAAAMEGTADARALDMRRRLAEYQAGREDIRRGDEASRYKEGMDLKREQFDTRLQFDMAKLDAEMDQSDEVTRRSLITSIPDLIREANDEITRLQQFGSDEAALSRITDLQDRIESLYKQYEKYSTMPSRGKNRFSGYSLVGQR
jgi:protein-disulfide isomerase-like protein with CxxC motif